MSRGGAVPPVWHLGGRDKELLCPQEYSQRVTVVGTSHRVATAIVPEHGCRPLHVTPAKGSADSLTRP